MVAYAQRYYVLFASVEKSEKRFGFMTRGIAFMIMVAECLLSSVEYRTRKRNVFFLFASFYIATILVENRQMFLAICIQASAEYIL